MDDVNMSSLICEEDISKELQQFNVKLEDREVLAKCKCARSLFLFQQVTL